MKKEKNETKRILGRNLAKELSKEDMKAVVGGVMATNSITGPIGGEDDCDVIYY